MRRAGSTACSCRPRTGSLRGRSRSSPWQLVRESLDPDPVSQTETCATRPPYWAAVTSPAQRESSMNRWLGLLAVVCIAPVRLEAQDTTTVSKADSALPPRPVPTVTLGLQEALDQARANSPAYRQTLNDASPARWGVRNAYGNFLPSVDVAGDFGYSGEGQSDIGGGLTVNTSPYLTSG